MINDNKQVIACPIANSRYFDAGNKLDYIKANIEFALKDPELSDQLLKFIKKF